ncbi:MAG: Gfo/Idh/MocA family oxidoreductase [Thermofilaceae archaeon]
MRVRVGFIGCGGIAQVHADRLVKMEDVELVAFSDAVPSRAQSFAERYGGRAYADYRQMLEREKLDAVFICIPPYAHTDQEILCAERGVHFFVEKPVALTLERAVEILRAVERAGVITLVGYTRRFLDSMRAARQLLREMGGDVILYEAWWIGGVAGGPDHWWRRRELSGGQLVEQSTHLVDLGRWLVGSEVEEVSAYFETRSLRDLPNFNIEAASAVIMRFKSGAIGSVTSTCAAQPAGMDVNFRLIARNLELIGSGGDVIVARGEERSVISATVDPYFEEDRHFIDCVKLGRETDVPYIEGVRTLEVTLAADKSAEEGRPVKLPLFPY